MYKKEVYNLFAEECEFAGFPITEFSNQRYHGPAVRCSNLRDVKDVIRSTSVAVKHAQIEDNYFVFVDENG